MVEAAKRLCKKSMLKLQKGGANFFPLKVTPNFHVITFSTITLKSFFWILDEYGKLGKVGEF